MVGLLKFARSFLSTSLILPVLLIATYVVFLILLKGTFPSGDEIISHFASIYERFGYEIIFISAFLEALVVVNFFVPGLITMAMGAVFARTGVTELQLVIFFASLGLILGYIIDFLLGCLGFAGFLKKVGYGQILTKAKKQFDRFGAHGLVLGFIYPNVASFLSFAAGSAGMNFKLFFSLAVLSSALWMPAWGLLIYAMGDIFLTIFTKYGFLVAVFVISAIILQRVWKKVRVRI